MNNKKNNGKSLFVIHKNSARLASNTSIWLILCVSSLIGVTTLAFSILSANTMSNELNFDNNNNNNNINNQTPFNSVIFVPGDGGSQLEARLNKSHRVHYYCAQQSDWYDLWINVHLLAPLVIDCFYDNAKLHFNSTSRRTQDTDGVQVRARDFGSLEPVAYLNKVRLPKTDYFETIIRELVKVNKLERDRDLLGASFDFRRAPNELDTWLTNLTNLIESQYVASGLRPVTLICHSMGCLNAVHLLNQKSDTWKEIHVRRLVALGAPWSGSFKALSAMLFGDPLGIPFLDANKLRELQGSWPSLMYLFPREPAFERNRTLVESPQEIFTLDNLNDLFEAAQLPEQREIWHETRGIADRLEAPNVELWCLYGTRVETPSKLKLDEPLAEAMEKIHFTEEMGDGDGTVNIESSELCREWARQQEKRVYLRKFPNIDHMAIIRDPRPAKYISQVILAGDLIAS